LASNSLLEGLVFGARAGAAAIADNLPAPNQTEVEPVEFDLAQWRLDPHTKSRVQELMWNKVGLIRRGTEMQAAIEELATLATTNINQRTRNFATLAKLMAEAALWREESRGGHYREDFPTRDDANWDKHSAQQIGQGIHSLLKLSEDD
jgi:L-aspartate oxidase